MIQTRPMLTLHDASCSVCFLFVCETGSVPAGQMHVGLDCVRLRTLTIIESMTNEG
jgi:hypothetical protein